ncbi:hypothetical protein EON81_28300, partial [bacterium]
MTPETPPEWIFLGYRVKKPYPFFGQLVCCLGDVLCEPPDDLEQRWDFNRASCYESPEVAWNTVSPSDPGFRLFAYELLPLRLFEGQIPKRFPVDDILELGLPELPENQAIAKELTFLGFDVVELFGSGWAHSLFCDSGLGSSDELNRFGLFDDLKAAMEGCAHANKAV